MASDEERWEYVMADDIRLNYMVSSYGRIKTLQCGRNEPRKLISAQTNAKSNYSHVLLSHKNKQYHFKLHILVAKTFIPNPNNLPMVNHIDGDRSNNHVSNLEWICRVGNRRHAVEELGMQTFRTPVDQYDLEGNFIQRHETIKAASEASGVSQYVIRRICRGNEVIEKKYDWRYSNGDTRLEENIPEGKQYPGYPNYIITNDGRVYNIQRRSRVSIDTKSSYPRVNLNIGTGKPKGFYVHVLVATLYVPNPDPETKTQVNHIDSDRGNYHYTNLEWTSRSENLLHAYSEGKLMNKRKEVVQYDKDTLEEIAHFASTKEAQRQTQISATSIASACRGVNTHFCKGFIWRYTCDLDKEEDKKEDEIKEPDVSVPPFPRNQAKVVIQYDVTTKLELNRYKSSREAARQTGVSNTHISAACRGRSGKLNYARGFYWRYACDVDKKET